ncbi:hypothetical protein B484DRAFT_416175, partial [Ochromonadaceae sp. CCMP2298]
MQEQAQQQAQQQAQMQEQIEMQQQAQARQEDMYQAQVQAQQAQFEAQEAHTQQIQWAEQRAGLGAVAEGAVAEGMGQEQGMGGMGQGQSQGGVQSTVQGDQGWTGGQGRRTFYSKRQMRQLRSQHRPSVQGPGTWLALEPEMLREAEGWAGA